MNYVDKIEFNEREQYIKELFITEDVYDISENKVNFILRCLDYCELGYGA